MNGSSNASVAELRKRQSELNAQLVLAVHNAGMGALDKTPNEARTVAIRWLMNVKGISKSEAEATSVDDAIRQLNRSRPETTKLDRSASDATQFLALAMEIRIRIEASPQGWWKDTWRLTHQLEQIRKRLSPNRPEGFYITDDTRTNEKTAKHIQENASNVGLLSISCDAVSYTHLTLPTNREV